MINLQRPETLSIFRYNFFFIAAITMFWFSVNSIIRTRLVCKWKWFFGTDDTIWTLSCIETENSSKISNTFYYLRKLRIFSIVFTIQLLLSTVVKGKCPSILSKTLLPPWKILKKNKTSVNRSNIFSRIENRTFRTKLWQSQFLFLKSLHLPYDPHSKCNG